MDNTENTNTIPAEEPVKDIEVVGINFRRAGKIYYFAPGKYTSLKIGDKVIVETSRGIEMGTVKTACKAVPETEIVPPLKEILRAATKEDLEQAQANRKLEEEARIICKREIAAHKLDMHLVDVEYTFDNKKLLFYFTSEGRVDFRELVKDLAAVFKTRIELRQIGIRDETKMVGGLGACGRPFCCAGFLTDFVQVSIKMAKEQNFSLNSTKISGCCGRLMCCLRYEHEAYEEALLKTPPVNSAVSTPAGNGIVIETRPLLSVVKVKTDEKQETHLFRCDEVKVLKKQNKQNSENPNEEIAEPEVPASISPDASPEEGNTNTEQPKKRNDRRHRNKHKKNKKQE